MDKGLRSVITWTFVIGAIFAAFIVWITYEQDSVSSNTSKEYEEIITIPSPTTDDVVIVFIDDIPTAIAFSPTQKPTNTPTTTNTPIPTPTIVTPTPTIEPTKVVKEISITNTPTPTKKQAKTTITPYPVGKVGTQYTDDKNAHTWKPYARYTAITKKGSKEYELQQIAKTASNGIRVVTDPNGVERYCIALAPQWAGGQSVDIGRCIDIKMTNGTTLHCVLGDCKKHEHTQNKEGRYGSKGELIEFQVDMDRLPDKARNCGDVSYVGPEFEGGIVSVTVLDLYIDGFWR